MHVRALLALTLVVAALAGCGAATGGGTTAAPHVATAAASPRPCAGADVRLLAGAGGVRVETDSTGSGSTAVVMLHMAHSIGACDGWSSGRRLARTERVQVWSFARCGYGATVCPDSLTPGSHQLLATLRPVVAAARAAGAHRVVLVGASSGASDAIQVGTAAGADAVVALSEDVADDGGPAGLRADRTPTLMMYAPGDRYCPPMSQRADLRSLGARTKRLVVVPRPGAHGWALLADRSAYRMVAGWIHGRYAG